MSVRIGPPATRARGDAQNPLVPGALSSTSRDVHTRVLASADRPTPYAPGGNANTTVTPGDMRSSNILVNLPLGAMSMLHTHARNLTQDFVRTIPFVPFDPSSCRSPGLPLDGGCQFSLTTGALLRAQAALYGTNARPGRCEYSLIHLLSP
jgi:hypothetical protein